MGKPSIDLGEWTQDPSKAVEPSVGKKAKGFNPDEKPPAQYFNWYWKGLLEWAKWLFTVSIDTATNISSFDINKGVGVSNDGTNTTTINCYSTEIDENSNLGTVTRSSLTEVKSATNFNIENSQDVIFDSDSITSLTLKNTSDLIIGESGSASDDIKVENSYVGEIAGANLSAEFCTSFLLKGINNFLKNCSNVQIGETVTNSSMENVSNFEETRDNTKTLEDLRIKGSKVLRKIFDSYPVYRIGNTKQKVFGNRYLSEKSTMYWHSEDSVDWRVPNPPFNTVSNFFITGGQQSTDGLFATSVELVDSSDTIEYPISPSYDEEQDHTFSFWSKLNVTDWVGANSICYFFGYDNVAATFGWTITRSSTTGFTFLVRSSSGSYDKYITNIPIKEGIFQHICVTFNESTSTYTLYIDSVFCGEISVDSVVGDTGQVKLKTGHNGADTSPISVNISDVSFWTASIKSPQEIQKIYSGGIEMSVASPLLFVDSEISVIQKYGNNPIEAPFYLDVTDDLFVSLKFPDWMKNSANIAATTIDVYTEKYVLEDF